MDAGTYANNAIASAPVHPDRNGSRRALSWQIDGPDDIVLLVRTLAARPSH